MTVDLNDVCSGLSDAADTIVGLVCSPYVPSSVIAPHFFIAEIDQEYDKTFSSGMHELTVTCRLLVSRADDISGQELLNDYLSPSGTNSIKAALEAERGGPGSLSLGGACDDFHVVRSTGRRWYTHAGYDYVGAEFMVYVIG